MSGKLPDRKLAFDARIIDRFFWQIKSGLHSRDVSAHRYCHVVLKTTPCPYTVTVYSARIIGRAICSLSSTTCVVEGFGISLAYFQT
jgi:hypothetical protein